MDWRFNTIWFEQIEPSKVRTFQCGDGPPDKLDGLEYVTLWKYKQKNGALDYLPMSETVLYLEFNLGGTRSLDGIGRFRMLKRLELHRCLKLEADDSLDQLSDTLEHLHISNSSKFSVGENLLRLKNLRVLRLNDCADIEDLSFLRHFPRLIDFRFVGTNVKNGDLSPVLEHQTLCSIGSGDKRHYNLRIQDVERRLSEKLPQVRKEYVYKEQIEPIPMRCETFRYID